MRTKRSSMHRHYSKGYGSNRSAVSLQILPFFASFMLVSAVIGLGAAGGMVLRLLLADDHDVVRAGLRAVIEANQDWQVVAEAEDGGKAVAQALETRPDIAVVDYFLPVLNGAEATRQIKKRLPETEVLTFTLSDHEAVLQD